MRRAETANQFHLNTGLSYISCLEMLQQGWLLDITVQDGEIVMTWSKTQKP